MVIFNHGVIAGIGGLLRAFTIVSVKNMLIKMFRDLKSESFLRRNTVLKYKQQVLNVLLTNAGLSVICMSFVYIYIFCGLFNC